MANTKNKAGKNSTTNKSSNKASGSSSSDTKKIPTLTSANLNSDDRERRDGPGGN